MKEINILPQGYRAFTAILNDGVTGRIEYPKWYSSKAVISIGKSVYTLEPKGFWQTTQELKKDGVLILQMQMKWSGKITMSKPKDPDRSFIFLPKGFFKNGYVLTDYKGNEFFHIRFDFSWKKFNSGYIVTCKDDFGHDKFEQLLIMLSVHYFKMIQNSDGSGVVN